MLKFSKPEKVVLIGGVIVILLIVALGFAKQTFIDKKKKPFEAPVAAQGTATDNNKNDKKTTGIEGITLKKASFQVEVNGTLDEKVASYVEADKEVLKDIELNFDQVDVTKLGSYTATLSYQDETIDIPIIVKDTKAPVITVSNSQVEFTLEPTSTIEELVTFVNATAEDNYDGVIASDQIKGWPTELSTISQTKTYTLQVKDSSGNVGKKDITVQYIVNETPSNNENQSNSGV